MDRETLAWALVFSVPMGVGITGYAAHVIRRGVLDPLAVLAGVATTVVLFAVVTYAFTQGSVDESREDRGLP